jgi:Ohr subfamily peroxiredoxin
MKTVAKTPHPAVPAATTVTAGVGIGPRAAGGFGLTIGLTITMPGVEREAAKALVEAAHAVCPYSNAVRGNVDVTLTVA